MKNKFTTLAFISIFFLGNTIFKAQDSKEILELKSKLALVKTHKEKAKIYNDIGSLYADKKIDDSAIAYSKLSLPIYERLNDTEQIGRTNLFIGS